MPNLLVRTKGTYHIEMHEDIGIEAFINEDESFVEIDIWNAVLHVSDRVVVAYVHESDQVPALAKILMDLKFFVNINEEFSI